LELLKVGVGIFLLLLGRRHELFELPREAVKQQWQKSGTHPNLEELLFLVRRHFEC
jgi:hypothetical protein